MGQVEIGRGLDFPGLYKENLKLFLTLTLVVRVIFYNTGAAVRNRDADFKK